MAFIFVPGPDGSFTEGDRQVNPDTGVEYVYSEGAWRALGPKIEDEFSTLDDRYIKLEGTSITGDSYRLRGPNAAGDGVATYHSISGGSQRLYYIETPEDDNLSWVANVEYVQEKIDEIPDVDLSRYITKDGTQTIGTDHWKIIQPNQDGNNKTFVDIFDGSMNLYNVADPTNGADGWATNKKYVKDNFIGNKGTQTLNSDSWNIRQPNSNGDNKNFVIIHDGEMNLYHVADPTDGDDGWAANKKYVNDVAAEYLPLAGGNLTGDVESVGKFTLDHGNGGPKERKFLIKGETADGVDGDLFYSYKNDDGSLDAVNYKGKMTVDSNIVTKKFVDDAIAAITITDHTHDNYKKAALWKAVSPSTAAGDLQVGEFFVADNNNIYLHPKSANSIDLGISGNTEYSQSMTYLASIYATGTYNSVYSTVADKINLNVSSNNYVRV